jgi:hypothetical protein
MAEQIVAVALKLPCGLIVSLPRPHRHHHVINTLGLTGTKREEVLQATQGFLTSRGDFLDRKIAWDIAKEAGQVVKETRIGTELLSENLW